MSTAKRVLVAEDNVVLGDVIRFNLLRAGFATTLARTGSEALEILTEQMFDILVTDYELPGIDGEELCHRVRNELKIESLRIVMCSARGHELDRDELKTRLGIEAILFKPFSIRELIILLEDSTKTANDCGPQLISN
ncbi:MAG: response regulator [Planctomycetota bacterium]|nr:response regulator [Planctomycetota bacterium]